MAKNIYVGVNNVAKKPKNIYVGVNGVARKVKAAYVGVNGVARKVWPNTLLPDTYKRVEYISNATVRGGSNYMPHIKTGVNPDPYTKVYMKFMYANTTDSFSHHYIFSATEQLDNWTPSFAFGMNNFGNISYPDHAIEFRFFNRNSSAYHGPDNAWERDNFEHTNKLYEVLFNDGGKFYLNNQLIHTATDVSGSTINYPIRIFNTYYTTTYNKPGMTRIYSFKIWKNNTTLVRDFYPCYRISDNVNGLYDIVNNQFYSNANTDHPEDIARGPEIDG